MEGAINNEQFELMRIKLLAAESENAVYEQIDFLVQERVLGAKLLVLFAQLGNALIAFANLFEELLLGKPFLRWVHSITNLIPEIYIIIYISYD